jgi:hypothetical protein
MTGKFKHFVAILKLIFFFTNFFRFIKTKFQEQKYNTKVSFIYFIRKVVVLTIYLEQNKYKKVNVLTFN